MKYEFRWLEKTERTEEWGRIVYRDLQYRYLEDIRSGGHNEVWSDWQDVPIDEEDSGCHYQSYLNRAPHNNLIYLHT